MVPVLLGLWAVFAALKEITFEPFNGYWNRMKRFHEKTGTVHIKIAAVLKKLGRDFYENQSQHERHIR
jgi:hypothetical protein